MRTRGKSLNNLLIHEVNIEFKILYQRICPITYELPTHIAFIEVRTSYHSCITCEARYCNLVKLQKVLGISNVYTTWRLASVYGLLHDSFAR